MTDEAKTEEVAQDTPAKKIKVLQTPDEKKAASTELQGKSTVGKKKIRNFTQADIAAEIKRLEKGNHFQSRYYRQLKAKAAKVA